MGAPMTRLVAVSITDTELLLRLTMYKRVPSWLTATALGAPVGMVPTTVLVAVSITETVSPNRAAM